MSKFLVTGAAGFIGINTAKFLLNEGHEVVGVDNFCTSDENIYKEAIKKYNNKDRYHFDNLELCISRFVNMYFKEFKPDYVIHLAAIPSVSRSVEDPEKSIINNIISTLNVAEACREIGVKRLVYAGSSSYYGGESFIGKNIEPSKIAPLCKSPYAASKAGSELLLNSYYHTFNLPVTILRYFNVMGPCQNPNSQYSAVIPAFISSVLSGGSPIIYGDGKQSRDFTYVENVALANYLACIENKGAIGRTFDVGCGNTTNLLELLDIICKIIGKKVSPVFKDGRKGDVPFSKADISWIGSFLGYKPIVSLEEGLKKTIDYYKECL